LVTQFLRFLIVGCANTLIGLAVIYAALGLIGLGNIAANATGYAVGLAASFLLNKAWTFRYSGPVWLAFIKFIATFAVAYLLNLGTLWLLIHRAGVNGYLAQAVAIVPYTVSFFLLSRVLVFRPRP
jgi:putative flippase GtrA